jgi:hypothetical protein
MQPYQPILQQDSMDLLAGAKSNLPDHFNNYLANRMEQMTKNMALDTRNLEIELIKLTLARDTSLSAVLDKFMPRFLSCTCIFHANKRIQGSYNIQLAIRNRNLCASWIQKINLYVYSLHLSHRPRKKKLRLICKRGYSVP